MLSPSTALDYNLFLAHQRLYLAVPSSQHLSCIRSNRLSLMHQDILFPHKYAQELVQEIKNVA